MEDFNKTISFRIENGSGQNDVKSLQRKLSAVDGVNYAEIYPEKIVYNYSEFEIAESALRELLINEGFTVKDERKAKSNFFKKFLEKLANTNRETFKGKKPDCCSLNH